MAETGWIYDGYGIYRNGDLEIRTVAPGLYSASMRRLPPAYGLVDTTNYASVAEAKSAAERLGRDAS